MVGGRGAATKRFPAHPAWIQAPIIRGTLSLEKPYPKPQRVFSSQIPPVAKEVSGLYWWRSGGFGFSGPLSPWILAPHFLKPIFRNKQETRIEATKAGSRNKHVTDFNRSSVLFKPWNSGSDFKHALTQQPAMHRIETTVES